MTGKQPGQSVLTDSQWARQVEQRLRLLENPTQQRIGTFVLAEDTAGNLMAHNPVSVPTALAGPAAAATLSAVQQSVAAAATAAGAVTGTASTTIDSLSWSSILQSLLGGLDNFSPQSALTTFFDNIVAEAQAGSALLTSLENAVATGAGEVYQTVYQYIAGLISSGFSFITGLVQWFLGALGLEGSILVLTAWLSGMEANAALAVQALTALFGNLDALIVNGVFNVEQAAANLLGTLAADVSSAPALLAAAEQFVAAALAGNATFINANTVWQFLGGMFGDVVSLVRNGVVDVDQAVINLLNTVTTDAALVVPLSSAIRDFVLGSINPLSSTTTVVVNGVESALGDVLQYLNGQGQFDAAQLINIGNITAGIPSLAVLGTLASGGQATIADAVQSGMDSVAQGIATVEDQAPSQITSLLKGAFNYLGYATSVVSGIISVATPPPGSTIAVTNTMQEFLTLLPQSNLISANVDPTVVGVFDLALAQMSPSSTPITQGTRVMGFVAVKAAGTIKSIPIIGYPTGGNYVNISGFYLNVYKVDPIAKTLTPVASSGNIVGTLPAATALDWFYWDMPQSDWITAGQGDVYAITLEIYGSGTYNLLSITSQLPTHPTVVPAAWGATSTSGTSYVAPSTVAAPGLSGSPWIYSTTTPWFGVSAASPVNAFPPEPATFTISGTYTTPSWANWLLVVTCGDGGGGGSYAADQIGGAGGGPGAWNWALVPAQSITGPLSIGVGQGGGGGAGLGGGGYGGAGVYVDIPGYTLITSAGGYGGAPGASGSAYGGPGIGPGNLVVPAGGPLVNPETFYGGATQGAAAGGGNSPGGGGAGANGYIFGGYGQVGGHGAPGVAYLLATQ